MGSAWTFLHINGVELDPDFDVDRAEVFVDDVATSSDRTVAAMVDGLARFQR